MGKNITIAVLILLVLTLGIYSYNITENQGTHLSYIENSNENTFLSFKDTLTSMNDDLELITISNDDTFILTKLAEITKTASHAQKSITTLPINHNTALNTTDFLSLCEDYTHSLMINLINGGTLSETDKEYLTSLSYNCTLLKNGTYSFADSRTDDFSWYDEGYTFITDDEKASFVKMFSDFEDSYAEFEGIEYNGKYSAKKNTENENTKSSKEPYDYKLIEESLKKKYQSNKDIIISYKDETNLSNQSDKHYHTFEISDNKNHMQLFYDVTAGTLVKSRSDMTYEESILTKEEANEKALSYLEEMGITSLSLTSTEVKDNIAKLSYICEKDGVVYYPNSLTVNISMQDGSLTGFDVENYYLPLPDNGYETALTLLEAQNNLSKDLGIQSSRLAMVKMNDNTNRYAYEFDVKKEDISYRILIDADTGEELSIVKLSTDER